MDSPLFRLRGFKRPGDAIGVTLGKLERAVMAIVWRGPEVSVRDVHRAFDEKLAYTTLMTTLDRLYKKGLLDRRQEGRAFYYSARISPEEFEQGVARDVLEGILGGGAARVEPVLACIVDAVGERDRNLLDELDRLVKQKRRELLRKES